MADQATPGSAGAATGGSKRLVVGAHYGLFDWLAQRITAVVMIAYLLLLAGLWIAAGDHGYDGWAGLFAPPAMKIATLLALGALGYHAWVGVRDIWMDYVRSTALRLTLHLLTILALAGYGAWAVQILWSV
jgi:succinate dehydrogenase / fumarate reductase membrane anchor subunit